MKNKLFKAYTVLLLTLTFISHVSFDIDANIRGTEISVCSVSEDEEPYDDGIPRPWNP